MVKNRHLLLDETGEVQVVKVREQLICSVKCPNLTMGRGSKKDNYVGFFCMYKKSSSKLKCTNGTIERCEKCLRDEVTW